MARLPALAFAASTLLLTAPLAQAGPISSSGFTNPLVDTFSALGLPFINTGSLTVAEGAYTFDGSRYRYADFGAGSSFGEAIATDGDQGFIDLILNTPVFRAGAWIGGSQARVDFYAANGTLLGSTVSADPVTDMVFAGWADSTPISHIRFTDLNQDGLVMVLDSFTKDGGTIPEPEALGFVALGVAAMALRRRRGNEGNQYPQTA
jgi:hypothetical protein